ncbi:ATP-binding cassette, sub-B (MDR TAP), member 8 [Allomyces arbusculus]|nr:ATP-binding cassette, sub-B (MDR TAP), member 8 [Allomyces arbusculus]
MRTTVSMTLVLRGPMCARSVLRVTLGAIHADATIDAKPVLLPEATCAPRPPLWPDVWTAIKRDWLLLVLVMATAIAGAIASLWLPRIMGQLVNVISKSLTATGFAPAMVSATGATATSWSQIAAALQPMNTPALRLLGLFVIKGVLTTTHIALVGVLGERMAARLRVRLYSALIRQDMAFFDISKSSELVARVATDVQEFKHTFKQCVTQGLRAMTEVTGSVLHLLHLSPSLTLALGISMPALYLLGTFYGAYLRRLSRHAKEVESTSMGTAGEGLGNVRTVKAYAAEDREVELFQAAAERAAKTNTKLAFHIGLFQGITSTSIGSMILIVLYYGGAQVAMGHMEPGELMSYLMATQAAQRSLASLGVLVGQYIKAKAAAQRVFEFIHRTPLIPTRGGQTLPSLRGDIEFSNVAFAYPARADQVVLNNFNLAVPAGTVVALCGSSGSGKTTVVSLLERFYDPRFGKVLLDGVNIRDLDPTWLREQIGYIAQQPALFSSSIRENIRYGRPDATDEEVEEAAKLANAHEFISHFPSGYETVVGERGTALSGGQRQRIAIAAAILKNPRVLILDEATSALDNQSERLVQEALDRLMKGRTVLVIAHRLTTIQNADLIVLMGKPQGKILEMGTHAQLMARRGAYYKLHHVGADI